MTSFSSKKPIFRLPRSFLSLVILPSVRIEHSADKALFPPERITPVVVSSLLSTLTWPSLLFLSPFFLPRTPTQTTSVSKFLFSNHSPLQFLNLYSPPIRSTPSDSRTRTFYPDILPNSPDTFILRDFNAHHPTWDRLILPNLPGNDLFCGITSSGLEILNDPASPTLLHHSIGSRSSPDISLAPASFAPHCEWHTLSGLGSDHLPIEIVLPLSPVRHPNTRPPKFNYKKAHWDDYQSYIVEHLPSLDVDAVKILQAARSFSLFLVEAAKASIPFGHLGRSPKAWWSEESEYAVRERRRARSEAHQSEAHRLRYIDASRRASSVISRAKSATWQATCSNLSPRSDPRAVFRLFNATTPLIFAHIYLKQHPVPRAEPNDSSWMNFGKLAVRMLLPSTILSAPPSWLNSPLPSANSPLPLRLALTRLPILY